MASVFTLGARDPHVGSPRTRPHGSRVDFDALLIALMFAAELAFAFAGALDTIGANAPSPAVAQAHARAAS